MDVLRVEGKRSEGEQSEGEIELGSNTSDHSCIRDARIMHHRYGEPGGRLSSVRGGVHLVVDQRTE